MTSTNRRGVRAGVLGIAVGCGVAVWLAGTAWGPFPTGLRGAPAPAAPTPAPDAPAGQQPGLTPGASGAQLGGLQFGGAQLGGAGIGGMFGRAISQPAGQLGQPTVENLRQRYPFESISGRLDYEPAGAAAFARSEPAAKVTAETLKRLDGVEKAMADSQRWKLRARSLQILHSAEAQKFVDRPGFGLERTPSPSPQFLDLPWAPTIEFAAVREAPASDQPPVKEMGGVLKQDALAQFQQQGAFDFLDPDGFGFIKDRDHVAGFRPHQFRRMPELFTPQSRTEKWAVIRLELVSLLKHDQPAVYVTHALPRMDDTKEAATRPLIPFEEKALKALKGGDDVATESSGDRIQMLGALRATKQCLDCHQVKRGDLLGAFSWELQRQPTKGDQEVLP